MEEEVQRCVVEGKRLTLGNKIRTSVVLVLVLCEHVMRTLGQ